MNKYIKFFLIGFVLYAITLSIEMSHMLFTGEISIAVIKSHAPTIIMGYSLSMILCGLLFTIFYLVWKKLILRFESKVNRYILLFVYVATLTFLLSDLSIKLFDIIMPFMSAHYGFTIMNLIGPFFIIYNLITIVVDAIIKTSPDSLAHLLSNILDFYFKYLNPLVNAAIVTLTYYLLNKRKKGQEIKPQA